MEASNVKAMREALMETQSAIARCMDILNKIPDTCGYGGLLDDAADELCALREMHLKPALASPPRNCDVGTAEEQHRRFIDYCNACDCPMGCIHRKEFIGMLDTRCASMLKCYIRWAQMPYTESEDKDEEPA